MKNTSSFDSTDCLFESDIWYFLLVSHKYSERLRQQTPLFVFVFSNRLFCSALFYACLLVCSFSMRHSCVKTWLTGAPLLCATKCFFAATLFPQVAKPGNILNTCVRGQLTLPPSLFSHKNNISPIKTYIQLAIFILP